ncbi:MFS transporter [Moritella sp. 5]|uniref:MFS transporter n=1 Tax=Moritella sp. 5 TaxID=2746231 RepID=UPI002012A60B|nr:MFS transporter [Moritella sp. 5]
MRTVNDNLRLTFGVAVVTMSLLLILVVGYAQALKSHRELSTDTILAQTQAAKLGIEQILNSGVPLPEIAGLNLVLQPIVNSNSSVTGLALFAGHDELYNAGETILDDNYITIPLNNKFTQVGNLKIAFSPEKVEEVVTNVFQPMVWLIAFLLVLFIVSVLRSQRRKVYLTSFIVVFFSMAISVVLLVGSLYHDGLRNKAVSLADIVSHRLAPVLEYNIDQSMVTGIDRMLDNFRKANPEVATIAVYKNTELVADSQYNQSIMLPMLGRTGWLDYSLATSKFAEVHLTYQSSVVLGQLTKILKNFAILFFACGLVCFAFIRLLGGDANQSSSEQVLERLKPLFLGAVLMESLMAPIMPQFLTSLAESSGLDASTSAIFFTLYFLGFALTLLPAARLIETYDIRTVLICGVLLSTLGGGILSVSAEGSIVSVLIARVVSGVGQAFVFISVQGYILRFSDKKNKTQAAGIIVFCFNAGFIAGAAIGALLANYFGDRAIFMIATAIGCVMTLFSLVLPSMKASTKASGSLLNNISMMMRDSWRLMKIPAFIRTMLLVGIPTKAALTGIVSFAVPLMLAERGISKESIGQVLMTYAAMVLLVSHKAGPWVDKLGSSKLALSVGNLIAGVALIILGAAFEMEDSLMIVVFTTISMMCMGLSHGLINAPVVTHVVDAMADRQEVDSVIAATYRFLERLGHVSGPLIVGPLLYRFGVDYTLIILAIFFVVIAVLFSLFDRQTPKVVNI